MRTDTNRLRGQINKALKERGFDDLETIVKNRRPESWESIARLVNHFIAGSGVSVSSQSLINWYKEKE